MSNARNNYERWMNSPNLDAALRKEMEGMDEGAINDAF